MAYFAYGYFVKTTNGIFHSGHDFGPTLDSYKLGDSLGVRNGVEGMVVGILKPCRCLNIETPKVCRTTTLRSF